MHVFGLWEEGGVEEEAHAGTREMSNQKGKWRVSANKTEYACVNCKAARSRGSEGAWL